MAARLLYVASLLAGTALGVGLFALSHSVSRVEATHRPRFLPNYFVLPFIEDVPNTPSASIRVADCGGTGAHQHASLIQDAVNRWNATGTVRFSYDVNNPYVSCDSEGMSLVDGVISVFHNDALSTGDFFPIQHKQGDPLRDVFRDNDWGPESAPGVTGMYPMIRARIQISEHTEPGSTNYHANPGGVTHELGHAIGMADLYVSGSNPCVNDNDYGPLSVMACYVNIAIPQEDQDSENILYRRIPQVIPTGPGDWRPVSATYNSISLAWTDYSFNERDQIITRVSDGATQVVGRDVETFTWPGLNPSTNYCFTIAQRNAYGGTAVASGTACFNTLASAVDLQGSAYQILNGSLTPTEEGTAQQYRITVTNSGTAPATGSYAAIKFATSLAPDGNGLCWIPSVPANGGTNYCDTVAITTDFAGGAITVTADNNGDLVKESNENNNVWSAGATLAVKPKAPSASSVQVVPPYAVYQYTNSSSFETNYSVKVEWKTTCSGSTGWSTTSPGRSVTEPAVSGQGSNIQVLWGFPTGKCYRLSVRVNGPLNNSAWVIGPTWLCC